MKPKKLLIETAEADGSMDRLNQLISASQILLCEANDLIEEASDLMSGKGLMLGTIKKRHNDLTRSADNYFKEIEAMITVDQNKMDMFGDLEEFDNRFRIWAKVYKNWKPKNLES